MAAELREQPGHIFVVDVACGLEEDWGDDRIGAGVRLDEHNETHLPGLQDESASVPSPRDSGLTR
jgi:hypothetical protein